MWYLFEFNRFAPESNVKTYIELTLKAQMILCAYEVTPLSYIISKGGVRLPKYSQTWVMKAKREWDLHSKKGEKGGEEGGGKLDLMKKDPNGR